MTTGPAGTTTAPVTLERRGGLAFLWTDNPPVNAIGQGVLHGIRQGIAAAEADPAIGAILLLCRGSSFFSGADISEFGTGDAAESWVSTDRRIDDCSKPVIAVMHRRAFGGGLELALACQYRIAADDTEFAFPEVDLGLIPGGGGTQRFPRIAGYPAALDFIPSGRRFGAEEAHGLGVIDLLVPLDKLEAAARDFAEALIAAGPPVGGWPRARLRQDHIPDPATRTAMFSAARERTSVRWRDGSARLAAIDAIEYGLDHPFEAAMANELRIFEHHAVGPAHRALSHLFFAEREARRVPDLPGNTCARHIARVAIIGGGTMGQGITLTFAAAGIPTCLVEASDATATKALDKCHRAIANTVARGRISEVEATRRQAALTAAAGLEAAATVDLVIEAVPEDMALKCEIFSRLAEITRPGTLLASNTSNLDIDRIADSTSRPGDVLGLHFFSPANVMRLVEIIRGAVTSDETLATALEIVRQLRKQPVVARVCDGFIANRAFEGYWREAEFLVEEGASPYEVDAALQGFGMPMGPFAVADLVGLDIGHTIRQRQRRGLPVGVRIARIADALHAAGRLGRKNGAGWYRYAQGADRGEADPLVEALVAAHRQHQGFEPRRIGAEEIIRRCHFAVINEGAKILGEGIALRASDIDVAAVHGMGFPAWRGGPMHMADEIGLVAVAAGIRNLAASDPYWWRPAPLLETLAAGGAGFGGNGAAG